MDDYNNFDEDPLAYSEFTINFMPSKTKSKKGGNDEQPSVLGSSMNLVCELRSQNALLGRCFA